MKRSLQFRKPGRPRQLGVLVVSTLLTGCGCGSTPPPEPTFVPPTPTTSPSTFDVTYQFMGDPLTESQGNAVLSAIDLWERVIVGDLPQVSAAVSADACLLGNTAFTGTVDDLHIQIVVDDSPSSNRLGLGELCRPRTSGAAAGTTYFGVLEIYGDALETPEKLRAAVTHEMGHIFGFGTSSAFAALVTNPGTTNAAFSGPNALAQWNGVAGQPGAPRLEGLRDSHWREASIPREVMSLEWHAADGNVMTPLTIGVIDDIGYTVNYGANEGW